MRLTSLQERRQYRVIGARQKTAQWLEVSHWADSVSGKCDSNTGLAHSRVAAIVNTLDAAAQLALDARAMSDLTRSETDLNSGSGQQRLLTVPRLVAVTDHALTDVVLSRHSAS